MFGEMKKEWLVDVPAEIRVNVYRHYFGSCLLKIHATEGAKYEECRQLQFNNPKTHLALLRVSKAISREAINVLHEDCHFQIADCNCWGDGKVPCAVRQNIRHLVSPPSACGLAFFRLSKTFETKDMPPTYPEPHQMKELTYQTIFRVNHEKDLETFNKLLMLSWDSVKVLKCHFQDQGKLYFARIDRRHRMTIYNPRKCNLGDLQDLLTKECNLIRRIEVIVPDVEWILNSTDQDVPQIEYVGCPE